MVGGRRNKQHREPVAIVVQSSATAEYALAVLPQHLRATVRVGDVQRLLHHLSDSGVGRRLEVG